MPEVLNLLNQFCDQLHTPQPEIAMLHSSQSSKQLNAMAKFKSSRSTFTTRQQGETFQTPFLTDGMI
jgi:hypothetical protein